jgi:hypothetical protein
MMRWITMATYLYLPQWCADDGYENAEEEVERRFKLWANFEFG